MNRKVQVWLPLLFSITLIAGMLLGYKLRDAMPGKKFFSLDKSHSLQEVMDLIKNKYVDKVELNGLTDTAISAMLGKLDPHSIFIPAEELEKANEELAGSFYGIGIEFSILNDTMHVLNVVPDGPAYKAGLVTGDRFIKINDSLVAGKKLAVERIKKILKGSAGSKVTITYLRNGGQKTAIISRGMIPVSSVDASYIIQNNIGYIRLNKFTQVSYRDFMKALESLQKNGLKKLILDLRGNGGGVLDEATAIADEFLDGDKLITYTEGIHLPKKEYRCKKPGLFEQGDLVLLTDEGSASAAEVLAGALQDWDRATVMGRRTFGKGLVQEQYDLSDGSALRLTVARYYTPVGRSIQRSYKNGEKAYFNEITNRYHDGEMNNADSFKDDEAKVYKTKKGRLVYGGGGISPDIFVPADTIAFNPLASKAYTRGIFGDYAYLYQLQHGEALKIYKNPSDFNARFWLTNEDWNAFETMAVKDSVLLNKISEREKECFMLQVKSSIARQIWRNEGLYEILNKKDSTIKKAIAWLNGL